MIDLTLVVEKGMLRKLLSQASCSPTFIPLARGLEKE